MPIPVKITKKKKPEQTPFKHFPFNAEEDPCPYCGHQGHAYIRYTALSSDQARLWLRCGSCGKEFSQDR